MNHIRWINTPAVFLLIAYLSGLAVSIFVHPRRESTARCIVILFAACVFLSVVLFLNPMAKGIRFIICMVAVWVCMTAAIRFSVSVSWCEAVYHMVRAFFLGDFTASLSWQLAYYLMTRYEIENKVIIGVASVLPCYLLIFGAFFVLERMNRKNIYDLQIQSRDLTVVLLAGLFFYFMANISYVVADSPFSSTDLQETYARRTLTEFGAVAVLLAYHLHLIDVRSRLRMQAMETIWQRQADSFKTYEAGIALVNQKYHDLKYHLQYLQENANGKEKQQVIEDLKKDLSAFETNIQTGNRTLDTVLSAKSLECMQGHISLTCVADGKALNFMHPLDINVLFGNLLDNAIECERKISEQEKRLIHVSVSQKGGCVHIQVRNICEDEIRFYDGLPVSTKDNNGYHGFGTASVRAIADRYDGSLIIRCEDSWFTVSIIIPIP